MIKFNSCLTCHFDQIEHLKASHPTCKECFKNDLPDRRYPNWKEIENGTEHTTT
jgi:hypothetical protein